MTDHAEVRRLEAVRDLGLLDTPPEERFDRIVRLARRLFNVPAALVTLVDEHRQFHKAQIGLGLDAEIPIAQSFCRFTIREPGPMVVDDARQDDRFRDNPLVTAETDPVRFYAGHPLHEPGGNVVGALCLIDSEPRLLDDDQLEVLAELATFVEAELARGAELDRAGDVQRALLPRSKPSLDGYDVAGMCLPAHHVGGDFYDWYSIGDAFQVVLADVMGKGVPAAILGASVRSLLRGASRFNDLETAVNRAAYSIERDLTETSSFVTVFAARLDLQTHEVTYVDAGHGIAGVVTAAGEARQFESEGLPLGAPAIEPWTGERVKLDPGDTLVALSDGLLDLFASIEEAREAIRVTVAESASAQEVVDVAAQYARDHGATDDVTAVVVRRTG